jgi:hypothetical protein
MFIAILFAILFVLVLAGLAIYVLDDLESAIVPALAVSALGSGTIIVSFSEQDRTLIVLCVAFLAAAIVRAGYLLRKSQRRE